MSEQRADLAAFRARYADLGKGLADAKQKLADTEDRLYEQIRRELSA
jgi:hypothetical protein